MSQANTVDFYKTKDIEAVTELPADGSFIYDTSINGFYTVEGEQPRRLNNAVVPVIQLTTTPDVPPESRQKGSCTGLSIQNGTLLVLVPDASLDGPSHINEIELNGTTYIVNAPVKFTASWPKLVMFREMDTPQEYQIYEVTADAKVNNDNFEGVLSFSKGGTGYAAADLDGLKNYLGISAGLGVREKTFNVTKYAATDWQSVPGSNGNLCYRDIDVDGVTTEDYLIIDVDLSQSITDVAQSSIVYKSIHGVSIPENNKIRIYTFTSSNSLSFNFGYDCYLRAVLINGRTN